MINDKMAVLNDNDCIRRYFEYILSNGVDLCPFGNEKIQYIKNIKKLCLLSTAF